MSDADISIELFNLDVILRELYILPTLGAGEYIPINIIMFDVLKYASEHQCGPLPEISLDSLGRVIRRVFKSVRHRKAKTNNIILLRYLLVKKYA